MIIELKKDNLIVQDTEVNLVFIDQVNIKDAYNGLSIETRDGKKLYVCLRDYGYDIRIGDDSEWHHINSNEDIG